MNQIRALLICPDLQVKDDFVASFHVSRNRVIAGKLSYYPDAIALEKALNRFDPAVVFLYMNEPAQAEQVAKLIEQVAPGIQIVGLATDLNVEVVKSSMRAGLRDILTSPFSASEIETTLVRAHKTYAKAGLQSRFSNNVFSFVAAKPGSGATTVALHAGLELARHSGLKTLLLDLDQGASVLDFLLKLPSRHGLRDAVEYGSHLDESVWKRMVTRVGDLDFVGLGTAVTQRNLSLEAIDNFLSYARSAYDIVCLDLPSGFDDLSLSIMEQSNSIFLICTPELAPLHMANRRFQLLRSLDLGERTNVIVNRLQPRSPASESIHQVLQARVFATIPNAYDTLQRAIQEGKPLDRRTTVGRSFAEVARKFTGGTGPKEQKQGLAALIHKWFGTSASLPQLPSAPAKTVLSLPPASLNKAEGALIQFRAVG